MNFGRLGFAQKGLLPQTTVTFSVHETSITLDVQMKGPSGPPS